MDRKLIAILVGDVVGYSRLVGSNETKTIENLQACFSFVRECVADHGGNIFNSAGDSILAEFSSVLKAVNCAIEIQDFFAEINEGTAKDHATLMRFGIHLGDVVIDAGNYLGDGVNIAARLEPLAEPGGICVSDTVYHNVVGRIEAAFEDLGPFDLKNIDRPVHIYRLPPPNEAQTSTAAPKKQPKYLSTEAPAIAVLPFDNMSSDPEDEYFVDGLTEDLITALSAWRTFPVIARNSTFAYKGKSPDVRAVAEDLNARYILEGSVRKAGSRVRVNAQLIDAETGHHMWAEKFDRAVEDIFEVQDEITRYLAGIIAPVMAKAEQRRIKTKRSSSLQAWELVQRGMLVLDRWTMEDNAEARRLFEQALEVDPDYAQALTGLAYSHHRDIWFGFSHDRDHSISEQIKAAQQAIRIDTNDSMAHCMLGFGFLWSRDFEKGIAEGERAIALNPSNFVALAQLGLALCYAGRALDSLPMFEQSIRVNPRNPRIQFILSCLARSQLSARDYESAITEAKNALSHAPNYPLALLIQASALGLSDRVEEAKSALQACERAQPGFAVKWASTPLFKDRDEDVHFLSGLRKAGLQASLPL